MLPAVAVETVGAVAEAVPPVALVPYQFKVAPLMAVAVKVAAWPTVTLTGVVTAGAAGVVQAAATLTTIAERGLSQLPTLWLT